jgi:hypothetical protein
MPGLWLGEIEIPHGLPQEEGQLSLRSHLPSPDAFQSAAPRLLKAVASQDRNEAVRALAEMGVFVLSPIPEQLFGRLEFCVGSVIGRARLIPLVELAILAAELAAYDNVAVYLADAHALAPGPPELHDLHAVAGVVALAKGLEEDATKHLAESVRVCREDEYARLTCGIRPFNLMLAEKLLERGEKAAVLKYLEQCQGVWTYAAKQIASWVEAIQNGRAPDFLAPSLRDVMDKPTTRIRDLTLRSVFLAQTPSAAVHEPNKGARSGVSEMLARNKRDVAAAMKGKLRTTRN